MTRLGLNQSSRKVGLGDARRAVAARTSPSAPETDSRFSGDSRVGPRPQGEEAGDMGLKRAWTTRTPHSHAADGVLPELPSGQIKYRCNKKEKRAGPRGVEKGWMWGKGRIPISFG